MARSRPDILRDTETTDMINVMEKSNGSGGKSHTNGSIPAMVEDPVRRVYKKLLAVSFIFTCSLHILLDLIFQVNKSLTHHAAITIELNSRKVIFNRVLNF